MHAQRKRWQQLAAVAAGAAGIYLVYRRWADYRQELEDAEATKTYYRSSRRDNTEKEVPAPLFGSIHDADPWLERMELLVGREGLKNMASANVLVVGLGGVGSYAAEFLVRAGLGHVTLMDGDRFDRTNRNRQLGALRSTEDAMKAVVMEKRLLDVNPALCVKVLPVFLECDECEQLIIEGQYDYVVDCIDSLQPKLHLMQTALKHEVPIVSSMGAGGKTDPSQVKLGDISETDMDPFAKFIRKRLRKQFGILSGVAAVFSTEKPDKTSVKVTDGNNYKKSFYGTISYLPCLFGLHASSLVIREVGLKKKVMYTKTRRHLLKQGRSAAYTTDFFIRRAAQGGVSLENDNSDGEGDEQEEGTGKRTGPRSDEGGQAKSEERIPQTEEREVTGKEAVKEKALRAGPKLKGGGSSAGDAALDVEAKGRKGAVDTKDKKGKEGVGPKKETAEEVEGEGKKKGKRPRPEGKLREVQQQLEEAKAEALRWRLQFEEVRGKPRGVPDDHDCSEPGPGAAVTLAASEAGLQVQSAGEEAALEATGGDSGAASVPGELVGTGGAVQSTREGAEGDSGEGGGTVRVSFV